MKTQKMNFKNIKDVLSRDEMKEIMAGSGGTGSGGNYQICINCVNSAPIACRASLGQSPSVAVQYVQCITSQSNMCTNMFGTRAFGC